MSNIPDKWEADIRQKVQEHVFDYDPAAWSDMEGLLNGGQAAEPEAQTDEDLGQPKPGRLPKNGLWTGLSIVFGLVILGWLLRPQNADSPLVVGSWPIVVEETVTNSLQTIPSAAPLEPIVDGILKATQNRPVDATPPVLVKPTKAKEITNRFSRRTTTVTEQIPQLALPELLRSVTKYAQEIPDIVLPEKPNDRRKRDRNTLFPDVIEKQQK